jgi:hypothetical protein
LSLFLLVSLYLGLSRAAEETRREELEPGDEGDRYTTSQGDKYTQRCRRRWRVRFHFFPLHSVCGVRYSLCLLDRCRLSLRRASEGDRPTLDEDYRSLGNYESFTPTLSYYDLTHLCSIVVAEGVFHMYELCEGR